MMSRTLALGLLAACATTTTTPDKPGSRGPRASDHLEAARQQDELAQQHQNAWPEVRAMDGVGRPDDGITWYRTWDPSPEHARLAEIHRGAAAQLQADYDEACGSRTAAE